MLVVACPRCSLDLFRLAFDAGSRFRVIGRELCRAVELFELSPGTNAIEFVLGRPVFIFVLHLISECPAAPRALLHLKMMILEIPNATNTAMMQRGTMILILLVLS